MATAAVGAPAIPSQVRALDTLAMSEEIIDKLKILDYETAFCRPRYVSFASLSIELNGATFLQSHRGPSPCVLSLDSLSPTSPLFSNP